MSLECSLDKLEHEDPYVVLDILNSLFEVGTFDDLSDQDSALLGDFLVKRLDFICEDDSAYEAVRYLLPLFNAAYVNGEEIRDPNSPVNQKLMGRYCRYLSQLMNERKHEGTPLLAIGVLIDFYKAADNKHSYLSDKLAFREKKLLPALQLELEDFLSKSPEFATHILERLREFDEEFQIRSRRVDQGSFLSPSELGLMLDKFGPR